MGYGGALIWTGLAKNLKKQFPNKKIVFVHHLSPRNILLLSKNTDLEIYKNNPDIAVITNQYIWPIMRWWYHPRQRIVVNLSDKRYHYWLDDNAEKIAYRSGAHAIALACEPFHLPSVDLSTVLLLGSEEITPVETLLKAGGVSPKKYICIEPNAKKTFTANKQWPLEHWQKLVTLFIEWTKEHSLDYHVVQMGVAGSPVLDGVTSLTGMTTFRQTKKIIEDAALVIANEGGVAHLASSCKTKAIIISNPSLPVELMAYPQHCNVIPEKGHHNCGLKKPCPVCYELLHSIAPEVVLGKITSFLLADEPAQK